MTSWVFSETKGAGFIGLPATHWTNDNMEHCAYAQGNFNTDIVAAAKEEFISNFTNYYGESDSFLDGEALLSGKDVIVKMWGLVKDGNKYYWNGETKVVIFKLGVIIQ